MLNLLQYPAGKITKSILRLGKSELNFTVSLFLTHLVLTPSLLSQLIRFQLLCWYVDIVMKGLFGTGETWRLGVARWPVAGCDHSADTEGGGRGDGRWQNWGVNVKFSKYVATHWHYVLLPTAGALMMDTSARHPPPCSLLSDNNGGEIFFQTWDQNFSGTDDHLILESCRERNPVEWIGFG